jgi:hypothetical protein
LLESKEPKRWTEIRQEITICDAYLYRRTIKSSK